jgi:general secretion pathway protein N
MVKLPKTALLMLSGLLTVGAAALAHGATSTMLDISPNEMLGSPDKLEVGSLRPLAAAKPASGAVSPASGNPLWSVPLSALTATQERPIFSASRRPPPRATAGPRIEPVAVAPPPPAEIEHPPLELIGAIVGDHDAIAVFLDRANQAVVRLRTGESHSGWELSSILPREVTLKKADQVEVLALQRSESPPVPRAVSGFPAQPVPTAGGSGYVPFIPRSTPKNGESDGL